MGLTQRSQELAGRIGNKLTSGFKKNAESECSQGQPKETQTMPPCQDEGRQHAVSYSHKALERYGLLPNAKGTHSLGTRAAVQVLSSTIAHNPKDREAHTKLIKVFKELGRYDEAITTAKNALDHFPETPEFVFELLHCLMLLPDLEEAQRSAEEYGQILPTLLSDPLKLRELVAALARSGAIGQVSRGLLNKFFLVPFLSKKAATTREAVEILEDFHYSELIELAKNYVESQGGQFVLVHFDRLAQGGQKSEIEKQIVDAHLRSLTGELDYKEWLTSCPDHIAQMYSDLPQFDKRYWNEVLFGPKNIVKNSRITLKSYSSEYVNVKNGRRVTPNAPDRFDNRLFLFGTSDVFCTGVEDAHSLSSRVQELVSTEDLGRVFRVENCGIRGASSTDLILNLISTTIESGDVVIFVGTHRLDYDEVPGLQPQVIGFPRPHDLGELYMDESHFNWRGTKFAAREVVARARALGAFDIEKSSKDPLNQAGTDAARGVIELLKYLHYFGTATKTECGNLESYEEYLKENAVHSDGTVGSVAVNCNPITLGHLHLLEYAARSVDQLYVFVIEEDKSFFSFADRLELVTQSVAHLENVKVLKGGRFICTELTYPEYYTKESENDAKADAAEEASYFCEYIAPVLDIKTCFLGNEPHCMITKQYNDQMAEILPSYGVKLDVIERISIDDRIVSASYVRKLLEQKDFEGIRKIVPKPVYDFLIDTYMHC